MPETEAAVVMPPGWRFVADARAHLRNNEAHAVSKDGVAYVLRDAWDGEYPTTWKPLYWSPAYDLPAYQEGIAWPDGTRFDDHAPYFCTCGNDRLYVISSGSYSTSFRCPDCGNVAEVNSG